MALDPRVRATVLDYEAGRCDVNTAAERLMQVRRERGCLEVHAGPNASQAVRLLVSRVAELIREESGG